MLETVIKKASKRADVERNSAVLKEKVKVVAKVLKVHIFVLIEGAVLEPNVWNSLRDIEKVAYFGIRSLAQELRRPNRLDLKELRAQFLQTGLIKRAFNSLRNLVTRRTGTTEKRQNSGFLCRQKTPKKNKIVSFAQSSAIYT